jgi:hypothetical protein
LCTENLMSLVVQDKLVCQVWFISMGLWILIAKRKENYLAVDILVPLTYM